MPAKIRYRAIVTDLDGTIVQADGTVTDATVRACQMLHSNGIPLIVATARTPAGVTALRSLTPYVTLAVCCTGAIGWSPSTGQTLWTHALSSRVTAEIVTYAETNLPDAGLGAYDGRQWLITPQYTNIRGAAPRGPSQIASLQQLAATRVCAMAACHPYLRAPQLIDALTEVVSDRANLNYAADRLLDIAPAGVDKGTGVLRALQLLGVARQDAIALGDMPTDLPMFAVVGHSIAVANAHPDVLAQATSITGSVDHDGFAQAVGHS